jgi:hypothetical protein
VSFRLSRDAHVYIFSIDEEQNAHLIFPNTVWRESRVEAGTDFVYPPKGSAVGLAAALPEGRDRAVEMLQVVATKKTPLLTVDGLREKDVGIYKTLSAGTLEHVMSKLGKLDRDEWTMAVLPYEIVR